MRDTVERILSGKFDYEKGSLDFSLPRIELSLCPNEVYTGSFFVMGAPGHYTEGKIFSNDIRMNLITDSFSGQKSEIGYSFTAMGLEAGDVSQGEISVISNQGEYYVPYVVTIQGLNIESSVGNIKNLFHFTNLAKASWDEAVRLFYSESFISVFEGNDAQYKKIYLGLSRYFGNEQNVEEFLVSINKKQPIEYIVEQEKLSFSDPTGMEEEYINITRNGWGYTVLHAKTDASFITLVKEEISDSDFLGNYLSFPILINPDYLHGGMNYAKVSFSNSFVSFEVSVAVEVTVSTKSDLSKSIEYKRAQFDMMTYYEAFRNKKVTMDTWISETTQTVERMLKADADSMPAKLFKAQLLMLEERYNEAKWILDQAENEFHANQNFSTSLWAYYLYLTTLYNREESYVNDITEEITKLYDGDQSQWIMAWILLYLSEEYAISPSKKWLFIEQTISTGCYSPLMYVEAVNMLVASPSLLTKLTSVELRVLRYAAQNDLLTENLVYQFVYLAGKERSFSESVYDILKKCYEIVADPQIATTICELLIKGEKRGKEYYPWYLLAIESDLRVTNLYEYYMESLDLSQEYNIPKMVFLYFSYDSNLDWEHTAYLYSRIIAMREDMPDVFESYKEEIERFAIDEIRNGHMNRDMGTIYRFVLGDIVLTEEMSGYLSKLLFVHRISVSDSKLKKVVVFQSRECVEKSYPLVDKTAYIPIYNKDFTILFEDDFTNRYCQSVEYDFEKLMIPGKLAARIMPFVHGNLEFDVYACESSSELIEITEETRERFRNILESQEIDKEYKSEVRAKLMQYYYDNDSIRELDEILSNLEPVELNHRDRVLAERFMIIRGMYDSAYEWIGRFGVEGIEPKDIVKLLSKLITRGEYTESVELTRLAVSVFFRGKYDETILKYLSMYYHGLTRDMRKLFKATENFEVDVYSMCENMIIQMLYTGYFVSERMEIYRKYLKGGANSDIQNAFLAQCSFEYFVKEHVVEPFVFEELTKAKLRGEPIQKVCKLAYLKYYSEADSPVDDTVREILNEYIAELMNEGVYLSFFKNFMEAGTAGVNRFSDKTIIEYKTDPGKRVWIHYIIEGDEDVAGEYITEEMQDMYGGVHVKAFILFFGENLLYYITEESEDEELLTESASIQKSDIGQGQASSRFNRVNDIVIAKTLQDYDTANTLLYDYEKHSYIVNKMFKLQ